MCTSAGVTPFSSFTHPNVSGYVHTSGAAGAGAGASFSTAGGGATGDPAVAKEGAGAAARGSSFFSSGAGAVGRTGGPARLGGLASSMGGSTEPSGSACSMSGDMRIVLSLDIPLYPARAF
eukprot:1520116-Rhodomonas_salina.1